MPLKISRTPRGLHNLLSIFGGQTPVELEDRVRSSLEILQFYGLQQQQVLVTNNAALAENGNVAITNSRDHAVLFGATATVVKTATATALRARIVVLRNGSNGLSVASAELGPFGATETGACTVCWTAPYPWLLVPPWEVRAFLEILGTDATANVTVTAELGILG